MIRLAYFLLVASMGLCCAISNANTQAGTEMKAEFARVLGRTLTQDEQEKINNFTSATASLNQIAGNGTSDVEAQITTAMLCLEAKGAFWLKYSRAVCLDQKLNRYLIKGQGDGLMVGLALAGSVLIHSGAPGSVCGKFSGLSWGADFLKLNGPSFNILNGVVQMTFPLGANYATFTDDADRKRSKLTIFGIMFGKMWDIGSYRIAVEPLNFH